MVPLSVALLVAASVMMVVGVLQSSVQVVYLSIGADVVAGLALALSLMGRRSADKGHDAATTAATAPTDDRASNAAPIAPPPSPSIPPPKRWPTLEPAVELTAPGPGLLGRLRRRPLTEQQAIRRRRAALVDKPRPKTRRPSKPANPATKAASTQVGTTARSGAAKAPRGGGAGRARQGRPVPNAAKK